MTRRVLLLLLLLLLALPAWGSDLQGLLQEAMPRVERASGHTFRKVPAIREASREEVAALLVVELAPQLRVQLPEGSEEEVQASAAAGAEAYSRVLLGKYDASSHSVLVLPENLARYRLDEEGTGIGASDFLRAVVIHELVHALDEEVRGAVSAAASQRTRGEIEVWNALLEGHAQYVTRKVLDEEGDGTLFASFEERLLRLPPNLGEGERYLMGVLLHSLKFAYGEGRRFFDALPEERHEEVFEEPPASKSVILHPERYGRPVAEVPSRDLEPLWSDLEARFPAWDARRTQGDEALLRAAFGDMLDSARVEEVLARVRSARLLVLRPRDGGDSLVVFAVYETDSPEGAGALLDLQEALSRSKDERMTDGLIRILSAEYRPVQVPGLERGFEVSKQVQVAGLPVVVSSALGIVDSFCLEVLYSGSETARPARDLEMMARWLGNTL